MAARAVIEVEINDEGVVTGARAIEGALQKVGRQGNVVMTELTRQNQRANQAAQLLARTTGVQIPQALQRVIAQSTLVGPALSAAFNAGIVLALGAAVIALVPRIRSAADALGGFTQGMKDLEEAVRRANAELLTTFSETAQGKFFLRQTQAEILALEDKREALQSVKDATALSFDPRLNVEAIRATIELFEVDKQLFELKEREIAQLKQLDSLNKAQTEKTRQQAAAVREVADAFSKLQAIQFQTLSEGDHLLLQLIEDQERLNELQRQAPGILRELQDANLQLVLSSLEGEARVRAELALKLAELEKIANIYQDFPDIVAAATGREVLLHEQAVRGIERIRQTAADEELRRQAEIAEEQRRKVEEMAGHWDSFVDRVIFGAESWSQFFKGMLREMLATFLKFVGRMVIAWLTGLEKMRDIWEAFKKSLPGGGINISIGVGGTAPTFPGFAHGGIVDEVMRQQQLFMQSQQLITSGHGRLLAVLHGGEAVLNAGATRLLGPSRIESLNQAGRGQAPSFQSGGFVGQRPAEAAAPVFEIKNYIVPGPGMNTEQLAQLVTRKTIRAIEHIAQDRGLRFLR